MGEDAPSNPVTHFGQSLPEPTHTPGWGSFPPSYISHRETQREGMEVGTEAKRDERSLGQGSGPAPLRLLPFSAPQGHSPTDCRVATRLPAATPPPLAMAATDIILAAKDEAAMPAPVKPMVPSTTGTAATATTVQGEELGQGDTNRNRVRSPHTPHCHSSLEDLKRVEKEWTWNVGETMGLVGGHRKKWGQQERLWGHWGQGSGPGSGLQRDLPWQSHLPSGSQFLH